MNNLLRQLQAMPPGSLVPAEWVVEQLAAEPAPTPDIQAATTKEPDKLLTVKEAADVLAVDPRWVYRHADSLPFTRRLTSGTLRFSSRGIERYLASRR